MLTASIKSDAWKVLVMDEIGTRVMSAALTMYDIMERRVTIVEQLKMNRQPFPDMEVVYLMNPSDDSVDHVLSDFESRSKAKYKKVHLVFLNKVIIIIIISVRNVLANLFMIIFLFFQVSNELFGKIQKNGLLISRLESFKEIYLDFLASETHVYNFDSPDSLSLLFGLSADPRHPAVLGRKLANLCITLNEHPHIRYQGSSKFSREIATTLNQTLVAFRSANPKFWCNGDDAKHDRERGQIIILDRSFDPLSPLMHEYTYQAMANDLLTIEDGVLSYKAATNRGGDTEKKALLNENDDLWVELRHNHIAKVIEVIKEKMADIIQNNSGAALAKGNAAELDITTMAAAVKKLPEYTQTMNKLGQHVAIAQQCMDAFSRLGLMNLSQVEQTISTGFDEDGKEVKGNKLLQLVSETLKSPMSKDQKLRLLAIYLISQRNPEDMRQLVQIAKLSLNEQQVLTNFEKVLPPPGESGAIATVKGGILSSIFRGKAVKHAPTPEGEYADTRHVCQLKVLLEQQIAGDLPADKFPSMGPNVSSGGDSKAGAKSVRKFGANARWAKKDNMQYSGGRYIVFIAGGISYAEIRVGHEVMQAHSKEVVIGGTSLMSPDNYMVEVGSLSTPSTGGKRSDDL